MELSHLRYFLTVARECNVARAARRLAVAPSTLYRRLKDLEYDLGVTLFEHGDGDVSLSTAGRLFMVHAQRIVDEACMATENMSSLAKGRRGVVRIGTNGIAAELPAISRALIHARAVLTDLDIRLSALPSRQQIDRIRQGRLDLGFGYARSDADADIDFTHVQRQHFVLAVALGHPLSKVKDLRLANLAGEPFIFQIRGVSGSVHDRLIAACSAGGLVPSICRYIVDEDTQLAMVAAGMGITLTLEGAAVRRWRNQIAFHPVVDLDVTVNLDLVWNREAVSCNARRVITAIEAEVQAA